MIGSFLILVFSTIYGLYCLQTVRNLSSMVQFTVDNAMTVSTSTEKAKFDFSRFDQEATEALRTSLPNYRKYHTELAGQFADSAKADIQIVQARELREDIQTRLRLAISKIELLQTRFSKLNNAATGIPRDPLIAEWNSLSQRVEIYNILTMISLESTELGQSYREEAHKTSMDVRQNIFSLIVCTAGLIFGVVLILLTTALPPLKILTEVCGEIAKGKLFRRAEIKTNDEFGLLSHSFNIMIDRIEVKDRNLASILGAIPEAVFFFDRAGALSKESSAPTSIWFKDFKTTPDITAFFVRYLKEDHDKINKLLALIWSAKTQADPETIFELLPANVELPLGRETMHLRFHYRAQRGYNDELERIIVMVQNISSEVMAQRQRVAQENHVARILNLTTLGFNRCRMEFERQVIEIAHLASTERDAAPSDYFKRLLHGFKGSLSVLGFLEAAEEIHALESYLEAGLINAEFDGLWLRCHTLLTEQMDQLSKILKTSPEEENVRLSKEKIEQLTELAARIDDGELTTLLETFKSVELSEILSKYRTYVKTIANMTVTRADTLRIIGAEDPGFESNEKAIELHLNVSRVHLPPEIGAEVDIIVGHLIRNAIDHGIEPKWERKAVGKTELGTISIYAKLTELPGREHQLELSMSDDGRGIDVEKLKLSAVRKGLWTDDQAENATLQQALSLIFLPSFTTRTRADEISGRGVGLDAVKAMIEKLGGGLALQSKLGYGTRFKFQIPVKATQALVGQKTITKPMRNLAS